MSAGRPMQGRVPDTSRPRRWKAWLSIPVALFAFAIAFGLAFAFTEQVYFQLGRTPAPWLASIINSLLGLVMMIVLFGTVGWMFGSKQRSIQMGIFGSIVEALGRIAQGDFTVRLEDNNDAYHDHEPVGMLVKSVNTLAQELNQMEEMRQEFIANVSHEIQSPLTSIRGFAHALRDDTLTPAERTHYLNIIETESTRLSKLSENLLALASLDAESYTLDPKPYPLDVQVRDVVLASEPQWQAKALEVDVESKPITICADADLLRQVWTNLLHNSIKFTPENGKICLALAEHGERVEFRITDTGVGISAQDRAHIFERFFKADRARVRSQGGSGLGLAIASKIVELHHGTMAVESELDRGTVFTVTLPLMYDESVMGRG